MDSAPKSIAIYRQTKAIMAPLDVLMSTTWFCWQLSLLIYYSNFNNPRHSKRNRSNETSQSHFASSSKE